MDSSPEVFSKEEGLRLLKAGQLDNAIRVMEKVREKTDDAQLCSYLGAAYSQKGDKINAISAFEESLRLQETPKAYFNLALVYESVGRIDEAVREYRMATELDASYAPAQEALTRLHNQFAGVQPQAEPGAAAATQVMTAPSASQTQAFSGPPPGQAATQDPAPIADPFAHNYGPPPTQADIIAKQMAKEQEIADLHHKLMKNGVIYGAICGAVFFVLSYGAGLGFFAGALGVLAAKGFSPVALLIAGCVGAIFGSLVGLWIGYTSGGEGAGFQAGAALGALVGIALGVLTLNILVIVVFAVCFGMLSGVAGYIIGKMVDMSISD